VLLALLLLSFVHLPASNAQNTEPFKFFRDYVGLKEDQIAAIRNGKSGCKVVESRTPDEVFVFGSVYVQSTPKNTSSLRRTSMRFANFPAISQFANSAIRRGFPTSTVSPWRRTTSSS